MATYRRRRHIKFHTCLNNGTTVTWLVSFTLLPPYPRKNNPHYPLYRRWMGHIRPAIRLNISSRKWNSGRPAYSKTVTITQIDCWNCTYGVLINNSVISCTYTRQSSLWLIKTSVLHRTDQWASRPGRFIPSQKPLVWTGQVAGRTQGYVHTVYKRQIIVTGGNRTQISMICNIVTIQTESLCI